MDQVDTEEINSNVAAPSDNLERDVSKPSLSNIVYSDTEIKKLAEISIKETIQVNDIIFSVSDPYASLIGITIDVIVSGDIQPNSVIIADLTDSEDNIIYGIGAPEILFNNKIRYNLLFSSFTPNNLDYILSLNLYTIITSDFSKHLFAQTQMTISFKDVAFNLDPLEFDNLLMVLYDFDNDGFDDSYKLSGTVSSSNSMIYNYNGLILDKSYSGILATSETFDFTTSNTLSFEIYLPIPLQHMDPEVYYGILYELVSYRNDGNNMASYSSNTGLYLDRISLNHVDIKQQDFSMSHIARFDDTSNDIIIDINIVFPKPGLYYFLYTNYLELIPSNYRSTNNFIEGLGLNIVNTQISISANSLIDFPDLSTIDILIFLQFSDPSTRGSLKKNMFSSVVSIDQSDIVYTVPEFQINKVESRFYDGNGDEQFNNLILYIYYQSDLEDTDGYVNVYTEDMKNQYIYFTWNSFNENILTISIELTGLYEMNYTNSQLYFDVTYDLQRGVLEREEYYLYTFDYQHYDTHVYYGSIIFSSSDFTPQATFIVSVDDIGYDGDSDGIIDGIRFFIRFEMAYSDYSQFIRVFENGQRIYSSDYWTSGLHVTEISVPMSSFSISGNQSLTYDIEHSKNYETPVKIYTGNTNYYDFKGTEDSSFSKLSISFGHQNYNDKYDSIIIEYSYSGSAGIDSGYNVYLSAGFRQYILFISDQSSVFDEYTNTVTFTLIITNLSDLTTNLVNDSLRLSLHNNIYVNGYHSSAILTSDLFIFDFGEFVNPSFSLLINMPIKVEKKAEIIGEQESDYFKFSLPILAQRDGFGGNFWLDVNFYLHSVYNNMVDNYHYEYISLTNNFGYIDGSYMIIYVLFEIHSGHFDLRGFDGFLKGFNLDIFLQSDDYLPSNTNNVEYWLETDYYMYNEQYVEEPITSGGVVITVL